jgi:hypothetical protein
VTAWEDVAESALFETLKRPTFVNAERQAERMRAALRAADPVRALVDLGFDPVQALETLGDPHPVTRKWERCRWCGSALQGVEWVEISAFGDSEPRYTVGRASCPTEGCGPCCPVCRRTPGDIHSGACTFVVGKLVDPCRVSREDCFQDRPRVA